MQTTYLSSLKDAFHHSSHGKRNCAQFYRGSCKAGFVDDGFQDLYASIGAGIRGRCWAQDAESCGAGYASCLGSAKLVILGGLAELFSGAISMGLGGLLAALTDRSHYFAEEQRERDEVRDTPQLEKEEIYVLMEEYDVGRDAITPFVDALAANEDKWVQFMMDFELKMEKVEKKQAWISAGVLAGSYFAGGLIPMIPYFTMKSVTDALFVSIGVTVLMLIVFGFVKNKKTVGTTRAGFEGAAQTLVTGVLAAGASYGIVRAFDSRNPIHT
ncbi:Vacuolar iron transporter [Lachnellula occidentalis]|uniref:Vacuolar iron transporter n=1 Tax=Lachnellula occidentalis TaxID=215460 RepID=A0A8H8RSE9_9HELO|nr:Vacuolar iron transporter [Lachnellula occidentalis]